MWGSRKHSWLAWFYRLKRVLIFTEGNVQIKRLGHSNFVIRIIFSPHVACVVGKDAIWGPDMPRDRSHRR